MVHPNPQFFSFWAHFSTRANKTLSWTLQLVSMMLALCVIKTSKTDNLVSLFVIVLDCLKNCVNGLSILQTVQNKISQFLARADNGVGAPPRPPNERGCCLRLKKWKKECKKPTVCTVSSQTSVPPTGRHNFHSFQPPSFLSRSNTNGWIE